MKIREIDNLLSQNPFLRSLSKEEKLLLFQKSYNKINAMLSNTEKRVIINDYTADENNVISFHKDIPRFFVLLDSINQLKAGTLSYTQVISKIKKEKPISNLKDEELATLCEIAASKIKARLTKKHLYSFILNQSNFSFGIESDSYQHFFDAYIVYEIYKPINSQYFNKFDSYFTFSKAGIIDKQFSHSLDTVLSYVLLSTSLVEKQHNLDVTISYELIKMKYSNYNLSFDTLLTYERIPDPVKPPDPEPPIKTVILIQTNNQFDCYVQYEIKPVSRMNYFEVFDCYLFWNKTIS